MEIYRLVLTKYASELFASGVEGRWNKQGEYVVYGSTTRALALLENLVHRRHLGLNVSFTLLTLELPERTLLETIHSKNLSKNWQSSNNYKLCQLATRSWFESNKALVIKVPSSIVPEEYNVMINATHTQFRRIKVKSKQEFSVDERLVLS
jgi:RES domain-containing protein